MENRTVTACAEFPNDNPALHRGAIWLCLDVTGAAVCELPAPEVLAEILAAAVVADELQEPEIEVVVATPLAEPPTDPTPPVLEAEDEADDIEIVDELAFDEVIDESPLPEVVNASGSESDGGIEPAQDDPFVALAGVLEGVAGAAGASEGAIASLRIVLGRERVTAETGDDLLVLREQAAAWQGILRGDSEDFGACGVASLDEWSSIALARCMGEPARADGLRRELRRRGVAAFGLVIEAA